MIKLIKTITKNGNSKEFSMLAKDEEQAKQLLKDPRFKRVEEKESAKKEGK